MHGAAARVTRTPIPELMYDVAPQTIFAKAYGGGVILQTSTNRFYELNETSARVWSLLAHLRDPAVVAEALLDEYKLPAAIASQAVQLIIARFAELGLITARISPDEGRAD